MINPRILIVGVLALALLSGCVRVYRIDVQQGNDLTERQVQQLQTGMSRQAVRALLGTPLIDDPFRQNRWDYYYQMKEGREKEMTRRVISLFFEDEALVRIEGGLDSEVVPVPEINLE